MRMTGRQSETTVREPSRVCCLALLILTATGCAGRQNSSGQNGETGSRFLLYVEVLVFHLSGSDGVEDIQEALSGPLPGEANAVRARLPKDAVINSWPAWSGGSLSGETSEVEVSPVYLGSPPEGYKSVTVLTPRRAGGGNEVEIAFTLRLVRLRDSRMLEWPMEARLQGDRFTLVKTIEDPMSSEWLFVLAKGRGAK